MNTQSALKMLSEYIYLGGTDVPTF